LVPTIQVLWSQQLISTQETRIIPKLGEAPTTGDFLKEVLEEERFRQTMILDSKEAGGTLLVLALPRLISIDSSSRPLRSILSETRLPLRLFRDNEIRFCVLYLLLEFWWRSDFDAYIFVQEVRFPDSELLTS
jgi:hypothetical protein